MKELAQLAEAGEMLPAIFPARAEMAMPGRWFPFPTSGRTKALTFSQLARLRYMPTNRAEESSPYVFEDLAAGESAVEATPLTD